MRRFEGHRGDRLEADQFTVLVATHNAATFALDSRNFSHLMKSQSQTPGQWARQAIADPLAVDGYDRHRDICCRCDEGFRCPQGLVPRKGAFLDTELYQSLSRVLSSLEITSS